MEYIRFVIPQNDPNSGRRQGLFQAVGDLHDRGVLLPHQDELWSEVYGWFRKNLDKPDRFSRSRRAHAKKVALSWFKDSAEAHISRMRALAELLRDHGVEVEVLRTSRPGYIVYEDDHQVAAEPFNNTGA